MGSPARDAVEISSDEEDFRRLSAGPLGRGSKLFNNVVVVDDSPPQQKTGKSAGVGEDDERDDCVVLERDPDGPVAVTGEKRAAASDEVEIVAVKGQVFSCFLILPSF
jgi:hypothetical protein